MSASEFSAALKNKALVSWFNNEKVGGGSASKAKQEEYRLENPNVIANPVNIYRAREQTSEKTAFVITQDTIKDLITQFHGISDKETLEYESNIYFTAFRAKDAGAKVSRKKITVGNGIPAIYFPNISFESITNLVNNIMMLKPKQLAEHYEKGHVIGVATELLGETSTRMSKVDTTGSTGKAFLLKQLDAVIAYYTRLDLSSANLKPATDVKLYASFQKKLSRSGSARYLVELQPRVVNQSSAKEIGSTLTDIRKLFAPGNVTEKAVVELIDSLRSKVSDPKFQQDLLEMRSSPSFKDMLAESVVSILSSKPKDLSYGAKNVHIGTKKQKTANLTNVRKESKKKIAEAKAIKAKLSYKAPVLRNVQGRFFSLAALLLILNSQLQDVVSANMGSGDSRDVLNYRTGQLAESVQVERLSQSRQGMITAFYTYMRNPYATFSAGGRQEHPKSRDPKLLISKSIRDIASQHVTNVLRSVNV